MKYTTIILALLCIVNTLYSQNIGIGVDNPTYKLDVAGTLALRHPANNTAGITFDGISTPAKTFMGIIDNDRLGIFSNSTNRWTLQCNVANGYVGIGNVNPGFNIDVKGRPRIRLNGGSPGIWFDGSTVNQASFLGTRDENHVGMYTNQTGQWNFVMNVTNGNVGIGTDAPTSKLDVNGLFKMRSSFPIKGSVMISNDANGNAEWANPVAFRASGGYDNSINIIPFYQNTKIYFYQIPDYNIGFAYNASASEFVVPEDGIYHFEAALSWENYLDGVELSILYSRNNVEYGIGGESLTGMGYYPGGNSEYFIMTKQSLHAAGHIRLLAGDIVYLKAKSHGCDAIGFTDDGYISANNTKTWFTGVLVSRL